MLKALNTVSSKVNLPANADILKFHSAFGQQTPADDLSTWRKR